jgi:carbon monoxide dehydrogenase subunit G
MYESTQSSLADYNSKLKTTMIDFKNVNELIEKLKDVYVKAETMYPGVRVKIGNSHYSLKTEVIRAKIIKDHGEIVLTSY